MGRRLGALQTSVGRGRDSGWWSACGLCADFRIGLLRILLEHIMAKRTREHRMHVMFTEDEIREIDDYRYAHRIPTRAGAFRAMIRQCLRQEQLAAPKKPRLRKNDEQRPDHPTTA